MPLRIAQVGTGNAGSIALRHLIADPRFDLTAVWVSNADKVGRDAGDLAGLDEVTGTVATDDLDAVLATKPDCVVYCAMADNRMPDAMADCFRILSAGVNLVGTAPTVMAYPWGTMPDKYIDGLRRVAEDHGVSMFVSGVDPGFATDLIPLALAGTCREVQQIRCLEIADYATYDGATVMFDVMGFGSDLEDTPLLLRPGVLGAAWGPTIRMVATGLGIEIDEITETVEREPAAEAFEVSAGPVAAGKQAGLRFSINGIRDGEPVVVVEHITRLRDDIRPDWPRPAQEGGSYRVEITGEPSYTVDICPTSRFGDHNYAAILAGVGRVVNAIPSVVAAAPGIVTTLDLPLVAAHGGS